MRYAPQKIILLGLVCLMFQPQEIIACPLCPGSLQQTLSEDIAAANVFLIVELIHKAEQEELTDAERKAGVIKELIESKFKVLRVLKGKELLGRKKVFEYLLFDDSKVGDQFMIMGIAREKTIWTSPTRINKKMITYIDKIMKLPKKGSERLVFFQDYFENEEKKIATDAYDEFAKSPYKTIRELKGKLNRDQIVKWIDDPKISSNHRRLYIMLLGVCGKKEDLPMLEGMIKDMDSKKKGGLDAVIASFLILKGPSGLELIEKQFFLNPKTGISEIQTAMVALRIFESEVKDVIPKKRLLKSVYLLFERPKFADLIIADLARWEDWSIIKRLERLFKEADPKVTFVRVPIIKFLEVCPKPEAKKILVELKKFDPESFKIAKATFDFEKKANEPAKVKNKNKGKTEKEKTKRSTPKGSPLAAKGDDHVDRDHKKQKSFTIASPPTVNQRWLTVGIPLVIMTLLFGLYWLILRQRVGATNS